VITEELWHAVGVDLHNDRPLCKHVLEAYTAFVTQLARWLRDDTWRQNVYNPALARRAAMRWFTSG
jgi:hypothetical protein